MTDVTVPAETLASWAKTLDACWEAPVTGAVINDVAHQIRALLPQPAPTCPNCGHPDGHHEDGLADGGGCTAVSGDPATTFDVVCPCAISNAALPQVRALIATQWQPRVWREGDPEPEDVTEVTDQRGESWLRRPTGKWRMRAYVEADSSDRAGHGWPWDELVAHEGYGPLTEVPSGGAS